MQAQIPVNELKAAIARARIIAPRKTSISILEYVHMQTNGECALSVASFTQEGGCYYTEIIPGTGDNAPAVVHLSRLKDFLNSVKSGVVRFSNGQPGSVAVEIEGQISGDIPASIPEEFPFFAPIDKGVLPFNLPTAVFNAADFVSVDDDRPVLQRVGMECRKEVLTVAATNGHFLYEKKFSMPGVPDFTIYAPGDALLKARKIFKGESSVWFRWTDKLLELSVPGRTLKIKIDGCDSFPNYAQCIPTAYPEHVAIPVEQCKAAVKACSAVANKVTRRTGLKISAGEVEFYAHSEDRGRISRTVRTLEGTTERTELLFVNAHYLLTVLGTAESDAVKMSYSGPSDAIRFDIGADAMAVVMPLKLTE